MRRSRRDDDVCQKPTFRFVPPSFRRNSDRKSSQGLCHLPRYYIRHTTPNIIVKTFNKSHNLSIPTSCSRSFGVNYLHNLYHMTGWDKYGTALAYQVPRVHNTYSTAVKVEVCWVLYMVYSSSSSSSNTCQSAGELKKKKKSIRYIHAFARWDQYDDTAYGYIFARWDLYDTAAVYWYGKC